MATPHPVSGPHLEIYFTPFFRYNALRMQSIQGAFRGSSEADFQRRRRGQLCIEQRPLRCAELECKARARREAAGAQRSAVVGSGASRGLERATQQRRIRRVGGRLRTDDPGTRGWNSTC